ADFAYPFRRAIYVAIFVFPGLTTAFGQNQQTAIGLRFAFRTENASGSLQSLCSGCGIFIPGKSLRQADAVPTMLTFHWRRHENNSSDQLRANTRRHCFIALVKRLLIEMVAVLQRRQLVFLGSSLNAKHDSSPLHASPITPAVSKHV